MDTERKKAIFQAIKKLNAYHEIQNEMGRATAAFNFKQEDVVLSYFALDKEDVALEVADEGEFEGKEAVCKIVEKLIGNPEKKGEMLDLQLTTPMIEVADDLQTAKCVWWCPGAGAIVKQEADPQAIWAWGQIAVDFLNINGEWKIWHLHYFRYIKCDYKKGWVEDTTMEHRDNTKLDEMAKPVTYHNPYTPCSVREGIPAMPLPYETYTPKERYWELSRKKD